MTRLSRGRRDPLPPDIVAAIDEIEPCEHPLDFWDRLEAAVDADQAEPFAGAPALGLRVVTVAAAVAVIAVLAVAVFIRTNSPLERLDVADRSEQSFADPAVQPNPGATAPSTTFPATTVDQEDPASREPTTPTNGVAPSPDADGSRQPETGPRDAGPTTPPPAEPSASASSATTQEPATTDVSPSPDPPSPHPSPSDPPPPLQRIEAERMAVKTSGGFDPDAYRLYENGYVQDDINIGADGTYRFTVRAWGESDTTFRPELEVVVDGEIVGATRVDLDNYRRYTFEAAVVEGFHQLRLAFTNDPSRPENDVDLILDWVEVEWIGP